MTKRTVDSLIRDFRAEVHGNIPALKTTAERQRLLLANALRTSEQRNHSAVWWILSAHIGTLEKLSTLLLRDGPYESLELLAIARNIFENLVWLKLMKAEEQFGIVFYAQLLRNQIESGQTLVRKSMDEAALFDEFDSLDTEFLDKLIAQGGQHTNDVIEKAWGAQQLQSEQLDKLMRREFCLYADQATQNGYSFQAHLIRNNAIPAHEAKLRELEHHQQLLNSVMTRLLDERHTGFARSRWNWADRARDVKMDGQYRFLYSFTSRLLHSIPLNIITAKHLAHAESIMVLDYIVISAADLLEVIEDFLLRSGRAK